jgi:small subunit ribosomal protein S4e
MVKNHLKTMAAPKKWPINRKGRIYITRPQPGTHRLADSITLNFLLIELLKIASTKKEAKYILQNKEVWVDGRRRTSISFPLGLFDTISIKDINKNFRIIFDNRGKIRAIEIDNKEAMIKPLKIVGKNFVAKRIQLNLFGGYNINIDKDEYKVGDTLIVDMAKMEIKKQFKLQKGNIIFLTGGKNLGSLGIIEDVIDSKIIYKRQNEVFESLKKYAYVVGDKDPYITLK